jgi:sucrose-6-phosphate hydrolase SacC (GH32 family)
MNLDERRVAATAQWRPRVHYSPRCHWLSDPNGLVWHDGEYHLFYQHNPQGDTWGHLSWGHAVGTDLLHWQELALAIAEDADWMIFSGSVVVDHGNTSGFGDGKRVPMVACYTGCRRSGGLQNQQLAYSLDRGRTWIKHVGNPVLDLGLAEFRDPKVFRHGGRWVMLVSMATANRLAFFVSDDLRHWRPSSEFHLELPGCRVWECPDLLRLPVHGEPGALAWLLKFDVFEGHPGGGSGAVGVVGTFDGTRFVATQAPQWIDGGMDFYAAIAFGAMPPGDGRCVWLGWMNDHRYAAAAPTVPWRGAMSLPREVGLARRGDRFVVVQQPIAELARLRRPALDVGPSPSMPGGRVTVVDAGALPTAAYEIEIEVAAAAPASWGLGVRAGDGEAVVIGVDAGRAELSLARSRGAMAAEAVGFEGRRSCVWPGARERVVALRIVVDACSVEVFAGDGTAVLTEQVFPKSTSSEVWFESDAPVLVRQLRVWPLADAMQHPA